jgi:hypothetical protein
MSDAVARSDGMGATIAVLLVGLAVGGGLGWWQAEARVDPEALEQEMAAAMRTVDPVARRRALLRAISKMRPETLPALRAGFEQEFRFADECAVAVFASAWAGFDPTTAFDVAVSEWSNAGKRGQMTTEVAYVLGRTGRIDRAEHLISKLSLARVRYPTWAGLVAGVIRSGDLERATEFLTQQPDSADRNRIIESFLEYFVLTQDLDGAMAWVDTIPLDAPRNLKKSVFRLTARWIGSVDPTRAVAWIESQPEGAEYAEFADLAVAEEWIEHDPPAAVEWVMAHTTPGDRDLPMRSILRRFIDHSPREAAIWMSQQEPLGDVELGIPSLVRELRKEDPAEALVWAERLSDQEDRERMIAFVAGQWMAEDPEAAGDWMEAQELPEHIRQQIESERLEAAEDASRW